MKYEWYLSVAADMIFDNIYLFIDALCQTLSKCSDHEELLDILANLVISLKVKLDSNDKTFSPKNEMKSPYF